MDYASFQSYIGYRSAKEVANAFQKKRGFEPEGKAVKKEDGSRGRKPDGPRGRRFSSRSKDRGARGRSKEPRKKDRRGSRSGSHGSKGRKKKSDKGSSSRGRRRSKGDRSQSRGRGMSRGSSKSRDRSDSRPGGRGRCAICDGEDHWKNECPLRGTEADRFAGKKPPGIPGPTSRLPPKGPSSGKKRGGPKKSNKSYFSSLLKIEFRLAS